MGCTYKKRLSEELKNIYIEAEQIFDVEIRTECFLTYYKYVKAISHSDDNECFWVGRFDIILACIMKKWRKMILKRHFNYLVIYPRMCNNYQCCNIIKELC